MRPLELPGDLALLLAPFFDWREGRRLELSIALPRAASAGVVWSAGVVASWFGTLDDSRSARFPVLYDDQPMRDALVLAATP